MNIKPVDTVAVAAAAFLATAAAPLCAELALVPMPQKVVEAPQGGAFTVKNKAALDAAVSCDTDPSIPAEGYRHVVSPDGVRVWSADAAGRFYALQTLRQLSRRTPAGLEVPAVEIEDAPRFRWRGVHWDDCRHFLGKEALMKCLDAMAFHKLNVLHWHLTEDQGWRIEIKKYPDLVKKGAVRPGSPKPACLHSPDVQGWENNNIPYGPFFYSQNDIREIVEYAARLNITIVPEIELPGHALAAISAYPELGCTQRQFAPWWHWGVSEHIFCGGSDKVIKFLEDVLDEVCELFPGEYVHIGGDEAPKKAWKACARCQARIKALGLAGEEGLQGWMTRHFTEYLAKKGRRAIGWDEVLDGDPGRDTVIMSWRGPQGGIKAAARGNDAVMTPVDPCYLDNPQGLAEDPYEYIDYGFAATLERVYGFDPLAGIPADEQHHILGAQGNNWTEYTFSPAEYEWKLWPRMSAMAECLWTQPENKSWESFKRRIALLRPYQVNMDLMRATGNLDGRLMFLHCLPAFHDFNTEATRATGALEVTDEVFESRYSRVFDESENRMHTIKALFVSALCDRKGV